MISWLSDSLSLDPQKQFLSQRIAKVWNSLPAATTDFTNLVSFRVSLQNVNLRIFIHALLELHSMVIRVKTVSYTHLTLPTNREV